MVSDSFYMGWRSVNRQLFNPTTVRHNKFDGHIATAKLCGTHWIKYMLSLVLCDLYDLPPPAHIRDDAVVGHTKAPPRYAHIPQIAVTHSHPHYLLRVPRIFRVLDLPNFVVCVRDPRDILVSMYEKSRGPHLSQKMGVEGDVPFGRFIRGDVSGRTRIGDVWNVMLFFNGWGPVAAAHPDRVMVVKYEDMKADTGGVLRRVCAHVGIGDVAEDVVARAVEGSSRDRMREKLDTGETIYEKSVNLGTRPFRDWYGPEDRAFMNAAFARHLKCDFGYAPGDWRCSS